MCYSRAEGGLRCPNATVPRVNKALAEFREARAAARAARDAGSPDFSDLDLAAGYRLEELTRAYGEYAAHPSGKAHVEQQLHALADQHSALAGVYRRALTTGENLRFRAETVRHAHRFRIEHAAEIAADRERMHGPTAKALIEQHNLQPGDPVTIVWGGTKKFRDSGVFQGFKRGGQANRGLLLVQKGDGRILEHDAASIAEIRSGG